MKKKRKAIDWKILTKYVVFDKAVVYKNTWITVKTK